MVGGGKEEGGGGRSWAWKGSTSTYEHDNV